ncbi:MAG: hypothetical protein Q8J84_10930 [Flavobacteriaceae bacterium]|nr:hypothetical protein [Flavobacteriaceae bacterium]
MKTILFFTITVFFITINTYSQLDKKTWLVGVTGSFDSYKREQSYISQQTNNHVITEHDFKVIELSPKVGYFFIDKLAIGITPTFSYSKVISRVNNTTAYYANKFSVGPFARYYFLKKDKPFNILAEANYQLGFLSAHSSPKEKGSINRYTFLVGSEIFFNSSVGMEVLLGYKYNKEKLDNTFLGTTKNNGFHVSVGFQFHLEKL